MQPVPVSGITLKLAVDAQGGAADVSGDRLGRFTCAESLDMVHRLRRDSDAVLVGKRTVQADDPSLTVRRNIDCSKQPLRVVVDPQLSLVWQELQQEYTLLKDGLPTVIYHSVPDVDDSLLDLDETVTMVYLPPTLSDGRMSLSELWKNLQARFTVKHLMVEGGPHTALGFLRHGLVDRVILVRAPMCFQQPLESGITKEVLQESGLVCRGTGTLGMDQVEYWSRPELSWPTKRLSDWP